MYISSLYIITRKDEKSCSMYISSLYYNKEGLRKVAVCIYHNFIITRRDKEKLQHVYIITSLLQGRIKKVAVCIYHHFIVTRKDKKSSGMYISSLYYNKEG